MKTFSVTLLTAVLLAAPAAFPKDRPVYDKGVLLSMESSTCGTTQKDAKTLAGEILGTDSSHRQTEEVLCQEYVLQSDRTVYRIRPVDQKHPVLLPVGESVDFRIRKDKLYLFDPERDRKERQYIVLSMQPRGDLTSDAAGSN
jgi:hypothetical protein